jgi:hypothetical protein
MQVDKETLIKHRFWIGLGVAVPLILIAYLVVITSVSGKIAEERNKVEAAKKALDAIRSPKNGKHEAQLKERGEKVGGKKNEVWEKAYEVQDGMMTWPEQQKQFNKLYFGDPISSADLTEYTDKYYFAEKGQLQELVDTPQAYNDLKERLVQYPGDDPYKVVRVVQDWKFSPPALEEVWMAQEDIWVQRELLRIVRDTNQSIAAFKEVNELNTVKQEKEKEKASKETPAEKKSDENDKPVADKPIAEKDKPAAEKDKPVAEKPVPEKDKPADKATAEKDKPAAEGEKPAEKDKSAVAAKPAPKIDYLHRRMANPFWEIDLKLERNKDKKFVLRGTIKNITKKRQPLFNTFFKIQVQDREQSGKAYLRVDREPVPAGETVPLTDTEPIDALQPQGIYGVEQVFNWRTAPVKRVDELDLYYSSHRTSSWAKVPPAFLKEETPAAGTGDAASGMSGMYGQMGGGTGGPRGMGTGGESGGGQGSLTRNGLEKKRYVDRTDQVRRMPVGMVVIVDQNHVQDFLTAFANSRLRIQTTQVHWRHFRDSIKPPELAATSGAGPSGMGPGMGPAGSSDGPARPGRTPGSPAPPRGEDDRPPSRPGRPMPSMGGGMQMPSSPGPGMGGMPGVPRMPMFPSMPGGGMSMLPGGSARPGAGAEFEEEDPNLVELVVYGIASLYEKYPPKPATDASNPSAAPTDGGTPAPAPAKP